MKVYIVVEHFGGKINYLTPFYDKDEAEKTAKDLDEYWKSWNTENRIPLRYYEVRAFEEVENE